MDTQAIPVDTNTKPRGWKSKLTRSREGRLIAIIVILVVSWLLVSVWAKIYSLFLKKVVKIKKDSIVAQTSFAILFTAAIIVTLLVLNIDDMLDSK